MATTLEATPPNSSTAIATPLGFRGRAVERGLLLWNLPIVLLAAWGIAAGQPVPREAFAPALWATGSAWLACAALHVLFCLTRFDGDLLLLPLLSLLFQIGTAYHADLAGPATPGLTPANYLHAVYLAVAILAVVTLGGPWFKRLNLLIEERVWWRIAGDRPYYESVPFHLLLGVLMFFLAFLLLIHGIRTEGDALIQVPLPGGIRFTPSELIRLAVAFFLADYLGRNSRILRNLRQPLGRVWPLNRIRIEPRVELVVVLTTVLLYCFFFYAFRDFGPAAIIVGLTLAALYAATGRWVTPLLLGTGFTLLIAVPTWKHLAFHTFGNRVEMWVNPWNTHFVHGDHQARILWSMASGGWFGMGVGTQNLPRLLPLARNDAAFAGTVASMGLWVGLAVLALFAAITWRGMVAALRAPTDRTRLLGFCLTALIAFQAIWICGAMVRVFPFTGINVPFLSTGLSSLVTSAIALGTIWNVSRLAASSVDSTGASPEVLRSISRLAVPITAGFVLPAIGTALYACPWLLGDQTLTRPALAVNREREQSAFNNPYLERFRARFGRGRIFSADGKLLAVSNPTPDELRAIREISPALAGQIEKAGPDDAGERYYPLGASSAQLIGWTTQGRFSALEGSVETTWDSLLRGYDPGKLSFYWRTRNNPMVRPPEPQDLQLTIQSDLQKFAAERLQRAVREWSGAGGAAVVYDVGTGAVLAAATAPNFDPNGLDLERMEKYVAQNPRTQVLQNKALSRNARYFPGSSFKILTSAAALDAHVTGTATCKNGHNAEPLTWEYGRRKYRRPAGKIRDYERASHGSMELSRDMDRALAVSCNVFFARAAVALGPDRLHDAMKKAEFRTVPSADKLAEHLPYDGFGQIDVQASPLEMAQLAGAFGAAMPGATVGASRPNWVQAIVAKNRRREPEDLFGAPDRRPYAPFPMDVERQVRDMMVHVVTDPRGTAHGAFYPRGAMALPGITVGGKTGTAEFEKTLHTKKGTQSAIGRHAWFVGFARSDHELQPRTIAFAVLVEDVRAGGTGGHVCAPVARDLIDRILPKPGQQPPGVFNGLERFYQSQVRPRLGPLGPVVDWLRKTFHMGGT